MIDFGPARPQDCRLLVAITFHHDSTRLPILLDVVRTLAEFPVEALDCVVVTNGGDQGGSDLVKRLFVMRRLFAPWFNEGKRFEIKVAEKIDTPLDLPWQAKPLIRDRFLGSGASYSHFIHLEDDMRFSFMNFAYWHRHRPLLSEHRLIPSFARIEFSKSRDEICLLDIVSPISVSRTKHVRISDYVFVTAPNPYSAVYVFDKVLAEEYVASRSFSRDSSLEVRPGWETRERAASGLCWESPPKGFNGRHAIPIDTAALSIPPQALLHHLGDRYADSESHFGKLPITRIAQP